MSNTPSLREFLGDQIADVRRSGTSEIVEMSDGRIITVTHPARVMMTSPDNTHSRNASPSEVLGSAEDGSVIDGDYLDIFVAKKRRP